MINISKYLLLIFFLITKSIYIPLNRRSSRYYWKLKVDDKIPLLPVFIIPYLGYYLLIIITIYLLWTTNYITQFFISYIISYLLAGIFWYLFPNGVKRPLINGQGLFNNLIKYIYKIDNDTNGFPSAHIFASLICSYYLYLVYPQYLLLIAIIWLLIGLSTILVKQHYIVDILGGMIVFVLSIAITSIVILLW